jgi:hypothetical protein
MGATPVIRVNYSGISGEGQKSDLNFPFPSSNWRTIMLQNRALPYTRVSTRYQIPDWSLIHQVLSTRV